MEATDQMGTVSQSNGGPTRNDAHASNSVLDAASTASRDREELSSSGLDQDSFERRLWWRHINALITSSVTTEWFQHSY
jgi:hypothetical protein